MSKKLFCGERDRHAEVVGEIREQQEVGKNQEVAVMTSISADAMNKELPVVVVSCMVYGAWESVRLHVLIELVARYAVHLL